MSSYSLTVVVAPLLGVAPFGSGEERPVAVAVAGPLGVLGAPGRDIICTPLPTRVGRRDTGGASMAQVARWGTVALLNLEGSEHTSRFLRASNDCGPRTSSTARD